MKPVKSNQNWPVNMNRRRFVATSAACLGCLSVMPLMGMNYSSEGMTLKKMRIRVFYSLHANTQIQPDWPNVGFDFNPVMEKINNSLARNFTDFEFLPVTATGPDEAKKIIEQDKSENIDGYIVYQLNCWNKVIQTVAETGKPVLYADFQFGGSGGFLVYNSAFLRNETKNVGYVASSEMSDLIAAVACFREIQKGGNVADFSVATSRIRMKSTPSVKKLNFQADNLTMVSPEECVKQMKNLFGLLSICFLNDAIVSSNIFRASCGRKYSLSSTLIYLKSLIDPLATIIPTNLSQFSSKSVHIVSPIIQTSSDNSMH